jgi:hypothetical protein
MEYIRIRFRTASRMPLLAAAVEPTNYGLKVPRPDDLTSFVPVVKGNSNDGAQYSLWLEHIAAAGSALSPEQQQAVLDFVDWQVARRLDSNAHPSE